MFKHSVCINKKDIAIRANAILLARKTCKMEYNFIEEYKELMKEMSFKEKLDEFGLLELLLYKRRYLLCKKTIRKTERQLYKALVYNSEIERKKQDEQVVNNN